MPCSKRALRVLLSFLCVASVQAEVRVFVQEDAGLASLKYECTAGEVIRAFALDVSVDRGQIVGVSDFFRGESRPGTTGYGIFPAAFRDHLSGATNIDWENIDYTPLATLEDDPMDTLPGLHSRGVTLEFGGLWDVSKTDAIPAPAGTLCNLELSEPARISVAANMSRGGVVSAFPERLIQVSFAGDSIGPAILSATMENGVMTVHFKGGDLETSSSIDGHWSNTGNASGEYMETLGTNRSRFYRVRTP